LDGAKVKGALPNATIDAAQVTGKVAAAANADTVTGGLYSTGSYSDPPWLTGLDGAKIVGPVANATLASDFSGALAGDVTGAQNQTVVAALRGKTLSATAPIDGQVLKYNATIQAWEPAAEAGAAGGGVLVVNGGAGLTGGPITSSGTLSIAPG